MIIDLLFYEKFLAFPEAKMSLVEAFLLAISKPLKLQEPDGIHSEVYLTKFIFLFQKS